MPILVATAGAPNANSYCTLAEAEAYHESVLHADTWTNADDDNKIAALIWATRLIDEGAEWLGTKNSQAQALRWPRSNVQDRDGFTILNTIVPTFLKNATAEFARYLLTQDRFQALDSATSGIASVEAGSVSVVFDKTDRMSVFPGSIAAMLAPYHTGLTTGGAGGGSMTVPLVRA